MDHQGPPVRTPTSDADELHSLIDAGGVWGLAPAWVPRDGYASPTPEILRAVEAGLRGLMTRDA